DLRLVKLDYDSHRTDRERFGLVGVPMLVLLAGDKIVAKYGQDAQRVTDFDYERLEWGYQSASGKIDTPSQGALPLRAPATGVARPQHEGLAQDVALHVAQMPVHHVLGARGDGRGDLAVEAGMN